MSEDKTQREPPSLSSSGGSTPSVPGASGNESTSFRSLTADDRATIGKSLQIKGEVIGSESLYIDGEVEGAITLPNSRVTVGRDARVSANITAREVIVFGKVRGNITASDRVDLRSEGSVTGDVAAQRISIGEGAFLEGGIHVGKQGQQEDRSVGSKIASDNSRKIAIAVPT
jgi:cytoskeletal protein CcmA (bactofilin family)